MTKFSLGAGLLKHLDGIPQAEHIRQRQWITTNDLLYIHRKHLSDIPLSALLRGLEVYNPPKQTRKYSREFQKQLDYLRAKAEEDEYQAIVNRGKLRSDNSDYVSPSEVAKEVRSQITTIVNILVSVCSVVYAIWYWTSNETYWKLHYRVLLCLFFGILILVAEVVVFNSYLRKVDEARGKEKKKKEIKKIIETVVINKVN